jgi:DNA repair protein RecO (recombination protein O)
MLSQTEAIVLNYTKYNESSIIAHVLTQKFGRQSLLVYGIGGKKRTRLSSFQPLFILDTQIYYKPTQSLQKLKEFKLQPPLFSISQDIYKSTMALFLSELIYRAVREEFADERLFSFIKTAVIILEELSHGTEYFHLVFLTKLARYMGFMPDEITFKPFYDYKESHATDIKPQHTFYFEKATLNGLIDFLNTPFTQLESLSVPKAQRNNLLDSIVKLYELHILNFNSLKSFVILKEVFSD